MLHSQPASGAPSPVLPTPPQNFTERGDYNLCYFPIFDLFRSNQLDFAALAHQLNVRERRLKEVIQFRMGSTEVRQLFGFEPGLCYFCTRRVPVDKEAICYTCVRQLFRFATNEDANASVPVRYSFTKRHLPE